jgi:biopolymer transport protein ExbD
VTFGGTAGNSTVNCNNMKKHILIIGCIAVAFTCAGCSRTANTAAGDNTQQQVSITVSDDGSFSVAGEKCSPTDLASKLRQMVARGTTNAIIQNRGVSSNQFMAMMQACDGAGFKRITLATASEQR